MSERSRLALFLDAAVRLPPGIKQFRTSRTVFGLAHDLISGGMPDVLAYLDRELTGTEEGQDKKHALHLAAVGRTKTKGVGCVLAVLAQQNVDSVRLAPHRPGGLHFLVTVLEDPDTRPYRFYNAARQLEQYGGRSLLPRLELLLDRRRRAPPPPEAWPGEPNLDDLLRECIAEIRLSQRP